eukprot:scaffold1861_cov312-Pinguiococcus_pyrenoidosus.AAC.5
MFLSTLCFPDLWITRRHHDAEGVVWRQCRKRRKERGRRYVRQSFDARRHELPEDVRQLVQDFLHATAAGLERLEQGIHKEGLAFRERIRAANVFSVFSVAAVLRGAFHLLQVVGKAAVVVEMLLIVADADGNYFE